MWFKQRHWSATQHGYNLSELEGNIARSSSKSSPKRTFFACNFSVVVQEVVAETAAESEEVADAAAAGAGEGETADAPAADAAGAGSGGFYNTTWMQVFFSMADLRTHSTHT